MLKIFPKFILLLLLIFTAIILAQFDKSNNRSNNIRQLILDKYCMEKPKYFGQFLSSTKQLLKTNQKIIAFTFDACGYKSTAYNSNLIEYLRKEKVPATLFVTGIWIDSNLATFKKLASDTLFEIENHGLLHRTCSVNGRTMYSVKPTNSLEDVIDEIELNAEKIKSVTGRRPKFFRDATTYIDDISIKAANMLGIEVVSYDVLGGDALPNTKPEYIRNSVLKSVRNGSIIIMHFNHPENKQKEAMEMIVPLLRKKGFKFTKLQDFKLLGRN